MLAFLHSLYKHDTELLEAIIHGYNIIMENPIEPSKRVPPRNIVGSDYNDLRPTQDYINPSKLQEYEDMVRNGQELPAINVEERNDNVRYVTDGHHKLVAGMKQGVIPQLNIKAGNIGPAKDWSDVKHQDYYGTNE